MFPFVLFLVPMIVPMSTQIDYSTVIEGWPQLELTETKVTIEEIRKRCYRGPTAMVITSCYEWNFGLGKAWIWYSRDEDLEHERAHHRGHPHVGDGENGAMFRSLKEWQKKQKSVRTE